MVNRPIKVLYINGNIMKRGGIEAFMMNYFRHIDRNKVHIDFVVHGYDKGVYDDEILAVGSKIYHVPTKSKHPIAYPKKLREIFSSGEYQIVHSHCDAMSGWILKIAKESGVPIRIAHSHNTDHLTNNPVKRLINNQAKRRIPIYATHLFACSQEAGEWLFGSKATFEIINNAIDVSKFSFNTELRREIRQKLDISEDFVIGHVGRFDYQKNQEFLIPILRKICEVNKNTKLLFVGAGSTQENVRKLAEDSGVADHVLFLGSRADVSELYNAFDVFVLPSRFEGLGIVAIEAQANGLPCILSDEIPHIVKINSNVTFLPLNLEMQWEEQICHAGSRVCNSIAIQKAGYDIYTEAQKLQEIYSKMAEGIGLR